MRDLNLTKMAPNQTTVEREYNRDFIAAILFSFTRTWQCQLLFIKRLFYLNTDKYTFLLRGIVL